MNKDDKYSQLAEQDRVFLHHMLVMRYPKAKIAMILGVHRSTIYREIKRNSFESRKSRTRVIQQYFCNIAHNKYLARRKRLSKIMRDANLRSYVHDKLSSGWSPWQIEGRLKRENEDKCLISHESIYRYLYSDYGIRNRFYSKLRRKHPLRVKRNSRTPRIPKELTIHNRPEAINTRAEFGHWECDLMIFKRGIKSNLITLRERKSRIMIAIKNTDKSARGTAFALITTLTAIKRFIKSITFDQGLEFMKYRWIKDCLEADIYFCDPASPEQKGGVENGNGVIRVELPRSHNIDTLKQKDIKKVTKEINGRPLKCLDYRTPHELFFEETGVAL